MSENIKIRIIEKIKEFIKINGSEPTEIHLTGIEECDLIALTPDEIGGLSEQIFAKGPRKAIEEAGGTIFGKKVIWDAKAFEVK